MNDSLPPSYFEDMYATDPDPWGFTHRWYEQRKFALTAAALPRRRYRSGFEPGCSIGVLTGLLAPRCDHLLSVDVSEVALGEAARRVPSGSVTFERRAIPSDWPSQTFDLIVLSEVGYYLAPADLERLVERASGSLADGGHLVAVHWRPPVDGYPLDGAAVHDRLLASNNLSALAHYEDEYVLLEVLGNGPTSRIEPPEASA